MPDNTDDPNRHNIGGSMNRPVRNLDPLSPRNIEHTLQERKETHGEFKDVAYTSQLLKNVIKNTGKNYEELSHSKTEAIENILQKLSRLVNGDSNHIDSWHDICGYSQLIIEEIQDELT